MRSMIPIIGWYNSLHNSNDLVKRVQVTFDSTSRSLLSLLQSGYYATPTNFNISLQVSSGVFNLVYTVNFASS
jgi:hypothetical protein